MMMYLRYRCWIFTPFERLSNAVTEDGFGLGLSIVAEEEIID